MCLDGINSFSDLQFIKSIFQITEKCAKLRLVSLTFCYTTTLFISRYVSSFFDFFNVSFVVNRDDKIYTLNMSLIFLIKIKSDLLVSIWQLFLCQIILCISFFWLMRKSFVSWTISCGFPCLPCHVCSWILFIALLILSWHRNCLILQLDCMDIVLVMISRRCNFFFYVTWTNHKQKTDN